jgi:triacylglycerol lipase
MLVPGFFGFVNFGRLVYFAHVRELLEREFRARGADVQVHRARTHPVASLRQRARDLYNVIATLPDDGPVHIVGHSTGGLDARLLASPGVDLGIPRADVERVASRIRTVTSVCTPHQGSPLVTHFVGIIGEPLLRTLSIMTAMFLRYGHVPAHLALRFARVLVGEQLLPNTPVHLVLETLEREAEVALREGCRTMEDEISIADFMTEIRAEPHLIPQLMPQALDLFNASVRDREGVRYSCVVARCPAPGLRTQFQVPGGIYEHATHLFYQWLYLRTAPLAVEFQVDLDHGQREIMRAAWGEVASRIDNDGMVPTVSQVHGTIVHAATADHLDVIGHLYEPGHQPPHHDWIASNSGFGRSRFEALWRDVAKMITQ